MNRAWYESFYPGYWDWFHEKYKNHHHPSCEIIGYGVCTCHNWALKEWQDLENLNGIRATDDGPLPNPYVARRRIQELENQVKTLQSVIKKQMEPNEISKRLAECNELQDAYYEQKTELEQTLTSRNLWKAKAAEEAEENYRLKAVIKQLQETEEKND